MTTKAVFRTVGSRPIRQDGVDKVTGRAAYGADVALPGMLHGKVLRSPYAHARIVSIDPSAALAVPGVHAVVTGRDLPDPGDAMLEGGETGAAAARYKSANMLARDKVLYQGHAVAALAAVDAHVAEEAARLVDVRYEVLEPVLDVRRAMDPSSPILLDDLRTLEGGKRGAGPTNIAVHHVYEEGDVARGFAEAHVLVEREFETAMVHQGYIEPHNALARWSLDGHLTVYCSSQGQFMVRDELASLLGWPASSITVVPMEIGGGFGGKTTSYLEVLAALLSRRTGRPVKMTMTRAEVLQATGPTPGSFSRIKIGATRDGRITAMQAWIAFEAGAYPGSAIFAGCITAFGPYKLANFRIDGFDVVVNKPKVAAYRAPGATQAEFGVECVVNEICERLGMDPFELRLRNASTEGDLRADGVRLGSIGNRETLEALRGSEHCRTPIDRPAGVRRGRGMANGFWVNYGGRSAASVRLNPDGGVTLVHGSVDIGGTRTSVAMQLAEVLGIPLERVRSTVADTDGIAYTNPTSGSRVTFATGMAAYEAGRDLVRRVGDVLATQVWDVDAESVVYTDGVFTAATHRATLADAAREVDHLGLQLVGSAAVFPPTFGAAFSAHLVDVEVDVDTGKVRILRYTAAQDAGRAIYPPYVEGQIQGGVVQGIGWALSEGYAYDADGHLRNANLLDYRMPTTLDVPFIETIVVEVPNPGHPYGARGVGEVSIVAPPAAIASAIYDAIGIWVRELPMTPARVHAALASRTDAR